jgi:hypothetical protein
MELPTTATSTRFVKHDPMRLFVMSRFRLIAGCFALLALLSATGCSMEKQYPGGDDDRGKAPSVAPKSEKAQDAPSKPGAAPGVSDK